jgi:hypothetical protein
MQVSLETREGSRDRQQMEERLKKLPKQHQQRMEESLKKLSKQNETTPLTKLLNDQVPSQWSLKSLKLDDCNMFIFDFPPKYDGAPQTQLLAASVRILPRSQRAPLLISTNRYYSAFQEMLPIESCMFGSRS